MAKTTILKYIRNGSLVKEWAAKATTHNAAFNVEGNYQIFDGYWTFSAHSFKSNGVPVDISDCDVNGTPINDLKVPAKVGDKETLLDAVNTIASAIFSNCTFVKENHI